MVEAHPLPPAWKIMTLSQLVEILEDARTKYGDCKIVIETDPTKTRFKIIVLTKTGDREIAKMTGS